MDTIPFPRSTPGTEYTCNDFSKIKDLIEEFRLDLLFSSEWSGTDPIAEQYLLLCVSSLEQAVRHASLADLYQTAAIAKTVCNKP